MCTGIRLECVDGFVAGRTCEFGFILEYDALYLPGHGPAIEKPKPFVRAYLNHRLMREGEIAKCLDTGTVTIPDMVRRMYVHLPETMHRAAARSVLAHMEHMVETGRAICDGPVTVEATFAPVHQATAAPD